MAVSGELESINKFIIVVYKEAGIKDGFIITAYYSNRTQSFLKKKVLSKKH